MTDTLAHETHIVQRLGSGSDRVLWPHVCTEGGSGDVSSIFIYVNATDPDVFSSSSYYCRIVTEISPMIKHMVAVTGITAQISPMEGL